MFKITPIQEKTRQKEICELCGGEFRPDAFAYQMFDIDSGEIMGMSQFEIGEVGYIFDLKEAPNRNDFEAMFILGRQTMNFIDLCGAHTCRAAKDASEESLITAIGFKKDGNDYFCDMIGMFDGHCGCKQ
ncbi:MAG: hypothetical protein IJX97_01580 [Clostridia bacterium]|nr:hypothetical protein [Clostridia bacterium]